MSEMEQTIDRVRSWMIDQNLKINDSKIEVMLTDSKFNLAKVNVTSIVVGDTEVKLVRQTSQLRDIPG